MTNSRQVRLRSLRIGTALATSFAGFLGAQAALAQTVPVQTVLPVLANANGGGQHSGTATFSTLYADPAALISSTPSTVTVNLNNSNQVIDYQTFNIGTGFGYDFTTASNGTQYAVLNRVVGIDGSVATPDTGRAAPTLSSLNGSLTSKANISVWLVNAAGITFGANGTFSGGSLVLSTLENDAPGAFDGGAESFTGTSANTITVSTGASLATNTANGKILLLAQKIAAGGTISGGTSAGTGGAALVAASKASVTVSPASPLSISITEGTNIGAGAQLIASGTLGGSSVYLVATSHDALINNLLQVSGNITATASGGVVLLTTGTSGGVTVSDSDPTKIDDGIALTGSLAANGSAGAVTTYSSGLTSLAGSMNTGDGVTGGAITITSLGNLTSSANAIAGTNGGVSFTGSSDVAVNGNVTTSGIGSYSAKGVKVTLGTGSVSVTQTGAAGVAIEATGTTVTANKGVSLVSTTGDITVKAITIADIAASVDSGGRYDVSAASVNLGDALFGAVSQKAVKDVLVTASAGDITGRTGLALQSDTASAVFDTKLDAAAGTVNFAPGTAINTHLGNLVLGFAAARSVALGNVDAAALLDSGSPTAITVDGDFTANTVNLTKALDLATTGHIRAAQITTTTAAKDIKLSAGLDITGLALSSPVAANSDVNFGRIGISATGVVNATASGLIQAATITGTGVTLAAGTATTDGSADITAINVLGSGNLVLTARSDTLPTAPDSAHDGDILLGTVDVAGGTALVDNSTAGVRGNVVIGGHLTSRSTATVKAFDNLRAAQVSTTDPAGANVVLTAGKDMTGLAGAGVASNSDSGFGRTAITATGNANLTAKGLIQAGALSAVDFTAAAGTVATDGSIDIASINLSGIGNLNLTARSALAPDAAHDGDIVIGTADLAGGTATLDNTAGTRGNVVVTGHLTAFGDVLAKSAENQRLNQITTTRPAGSLITLNAGKDLTGLALSSPVAANSDVNFGRVGLVSTGDISITAAGLIQAGTASGHSLTASAGTALNDGSIDISTINLASLGNLSLTARSDTLPLAPDAAHDGDIIVGKADVAGGTALIDNSAGQRGNVLLGNYLKASGLVTINAKQNLRLANYVAATSGYVESTADNIVVTTGESVLAPSVYTITATGVGGFEAVGNLTIDSTGDVSANSLKAGGNLILDIDGSIHGLTGTAAAVPGGALIASAATKTVSVTAGAVGGPVDSITLSLAKAGGDVTLKAEAVAVGTLDTGGNHFITDQAGGALANYYIGSRKFPGNKTITIASATAPTAWIALPNAVEERFAEFAAFGNTVLDAGGTITGPITAGRTIESAQLGVVTAGGAINFSAGGVVATSMGSGDFIDLTATDGTLSLLSTTATNALTLHKNNGLPATAGDELRVTTGTAAAVTLQSNTHIRAGSLTTTTSGISLAAALGDISGMALGLPATDGRALASFGRSNLTAPADGATITVSALAGVAQLGTSVAGSVFPALPLLNANQIDVQALTIDATSADARDGRIFLSSNYATGGETRIGTATAAQGITVDAKTSVRMGTATAASENVSVTAQTGDVSGLLAGGGTPGVLDTDFVTTGNQFNINYGKTNLTSSLGSVAVSANSGAAQLGNLAGDTGITVSANGITTDSAISTNGAVAMTAQLGTLYLGSGSAGTTVVLEKKLGGIALGGDELRVSSLLTGGTGVTLTSSTHVRASQATATTGNVGVTATSGDISGLLLGIPATDGRPAINYDRANFTASADGATITVSALAGVAQLGSLTAGATLPALPLLNANQIDVQALAIDATSADARDGRILLSSNFAAGGEIAIGSATAAQNLVVDAKTNARIGTATAQTEGIAVTAQTGDVSGLLLGGGTPGVLDSDFVTTGTEFNANYGHANLSTSGTSLTVTAANGAVQLGTLNSSNGAASAVTVSAKGITADAALVGNGTAPGNATLAMTASVGTLRLGMGNVDSSVFLTKTGGNPLLDGDEIRVSTQLTSNRVANINSSTHIRAAQVTGLLGAFLTATGGDISGLKTGVASALPLDADFVTTGSQFSALYGKANVTSTAGNLSVTANSGAAQLGIVDGRFGVAVQAKGITADNAISIASTVNMTASVGTLYLGAGSAVSTVTLTKNLGSIALDGDELRVSGLLASGATLGGVTLNSSTHVRASQVTSASGNITVTATSGDISGLKTGLVSALPLDADFVTTGELFSADYGKASFAAANGSVSISALAGAAQLGNLAALSTISVAALGITADSAIATNGSLTMTANQGTLFLGSGSAGTLATLEKKLGSIGLDGDELRIKTALTGGTGSSVTSSTHIREAQITATTGNATLTATSGDISGLKTGLSSALPLDADFVTSGTQFSANYGKANVTANAGSLSITATSGAAQLGTLGGATGVTVQAKGITADSAVSTAGAVAMTANVGTLYLGSGSAFTAATFIKNLGSSTTDGDELRVNGLLTGGIGVTLASATHVRASQATATTGNVSVTAASGDISGLKTGVAAALPLDADFVTTGEQFSADYGKASFTAASGAISVSALAGAAQLGTLSALTTIDASAKGITADSAIATSGSLTMTANQGTLFLGSGSAGTVATLEKKLGSVTLDGDEMRIKTGLTGGTGAALTSATHIRAPQVTATTGAATLVATSGDISGIKTGVSATLPLPGVTTASEFSADYGRANVTASSGTISVTGNGGSAQLGQLTAGGDVLASARAITADNANAGGKIDMTATSGTLALTTGKAGLSAKLDKQGGSVATIGDELRFGTLETGIAVGGADGNATLTSSTHIRGDSIVAHGGNISVAAANGEVTGNGVGGLLALSALPDLDGSANPIAGTAGNITVTAGTAARLADLDAGTGITVIAGVAASPTLGGSISIGNGSTGSGDIVLRSDNSTSLANGISFANLAGKNITVEAKGTSGGDVTGNTMTGSGFVSAVSQVGTIALGTVDTLTQAGGDIALSAGGSITATSVTGNLSVAINAGLAATLATITARQDAGVRAGTIASLTSISALDDVTIEAGTVRLGAATATGGGIDANDIDFVNSIIPGPKTNSGANVFITATSGDVTGLGGLTAVAANRPSVSASNAITITSAGTTQLDVAQAGGALTVTAGTAAQDGAIDINAATAAGAIKLDALATGTAQDSDHDGGIRLGSVASGTTLQLTNAARGAGIGDIVVRTSAGAGSSAAIDAAGNASLAAITAGTSLALAAGGSVAVAGTATSGTTMVINAGGGTLLLGKGIAGGDATLASLGKATLGTAGMPDNALTAAGKAISLTASDAEINGKVAGASIKLVDRAAAANPMRLGDGTSGSGGFALSTAEINRLEAPIVVLDAGTGTGLTHQDTAIGNLSLTNAVVKSFAVNSLARVDLTGNLTVPSGAADQALRLGGTATDTDKAGVIRIAAAPDGTGGRIAIGAATLELRAVNIGAGQDAGFLSQIGITAGSTASATPAAMVSNPGSALYNALIGPAGSTGGLLYTPAGQTIIQAGKMTIRYSGFALLQNTGLPGLNSGVELAALSTPAAPALRLIGPNPPDAGAFAMFGKINGVGDTPAALLGIAVIDVSAIDRTSSRINGCLIGSGAGCLTTLAVTPTLGNIDPVRGNIFFAQPDFELPFDPLVGTNNDSLFGDVGTFGLGDIPLAPIECDANTTTNCNTPDGEAK